MYTRVDMFTREKQQIRNSDGVVGLHPGPGTGSLHRTAESDPGPMRQWLSNSPQQQQQQFYYQRPSSANLNQDAPRGRTARFYGEGDIDRNDAGICGDGAGRALRSASPQNDFLLSSASSQMLRNALGSVQQEIQNLKALNAARTSVLFPTESSLEPGIYLLKFAALEGLEMSVPLGEVEVVLKAYNMSYVDNEYLLEQSFECTFSGTPTPLTRHSAQTVLFTVPPHEFILRTPREMIVFTVEVLYRGRLLCWATIFAVSTGTFTEGLRSGPHDLAKALRCPGVFLSGASVSGSLEAQSEDVLQFAESVLRSDLSLHRSPCSSPAPLPGLPPLASPPQGLPLLPGMPGCEGPFLPPTAAGYGMGLQPTADASTHFALPPPQGTTIAEWDEKVGAHIRRLNSESPPSNAVAVVALNGAAATPSPPSASLYPARRRVNSSLSRSGVEVTDGWAIAGAMAPVSSNAQVPVRRPSPQLLPPSQPRTPPRSGSGSPRRALTSASSPLRAVNDAVPVSSDALQAGSRNASPTATPTLSRTLSRERSALVTFTEAAPPPQMGKVPCEDALLVERNQLRAVVDGQGNIAVPPGYKMNLSAPPCVDLENFDTPTNPPMRASVLFGLAKPTDVPPGKALSPTRGAGGARRDVYIDGVIGLPLDTVCARVVVYVVDDVDPQMGHIQNSLRHPRVFMRKPNLVAYPSLTSSSAAPAFHAELGMVVSEATHAVVIVEYMTALSDAPPIVLGHACVPIHPRHPAGNLLTRLKGGDPRRSQERFVEDTRTPDRIAEEQQRATERYEQAQLEASVNAQALRNVMPAPARKHAECVPLGFLVWRLDSADLNAPFFEMAEQLPLSQQEMDLFYDRRPHMTVTPSSKGLTTEKLADDAFVGAAVIQSDALSFTAPFNETRGAFIKVEGLRGVGDDAAMYVVVVYMPKAPTGRRVHFTMMPDWFSDVGAPFYKDGPFVFSGIRYDPANVVMYMLLKLSKLENTTATLPEVEMVGWTMNKLFQDEIPALRQGRFAVPWLKGTLPPSILQELATEPLAQVFLRHLKAKTITFLKPKATLTLSQGDPACGIGILDESPGRAQPHQLLMPSSIKKQFPCFTCEGMVGCTLQRAHEQCFGGGDPRELLQRMSTAVRYFLKASMAAYEAE